MSSKELRELRETIEYTRSSPAKVSMLEYAVQLADSLGDLEQGFKLRENLVEEALAVRLPQKAIVAFSWCLSQMDRHPNKFEVYTLLWRYKAVASSLLGFPQVTRQQLDDTLADLERRFQTNGGDPHAVHKLRCTFGQFLGDRDLVREALPRWLNSPTGAMTDCRACEQHSQFAAHLFLGDDERALQAAVPLLTVKMWCKSVPHITRAMALQPQMRLDQWDQAAVAHRMGLSAIVRDRYYVSYFHYHLIYQVITGNIAGAVQLFEGHVGLALDAGSPLDAYNFAKGGLFLFRHLRQIDEPPRTLKLPHAFPLWNKSGEYDYAELVAWYEGEVRSLASRFDERNGNRYFTDLVDALRELEKLTPPNKTRME